MFNEITTMNESISFKEKKQNKNYTERYTDALITNLNIFMLNTAVILYNCHNCRVTSSLFLAHVKLSNLHDAHVRSLNELGNYQCKKGGALYLSLAANVLYYSCMCHVY